MYTEIPLGTQVRDELSRKGFNVEHKVSPMFYGGVQVLVKDERERMLLLVLEMTEETGLGNQINRR